MMWSSGFTRWRNSYHPWLTLLHFLETWQRYRLSFRSVSRLAGLQTLASDVFLAKVKDAILVDKPGSSSWTIWFPEIRPNRVRYFALQSLSGTWWDISPPPSTWNYLMAIMKKRVFPHLPFSFSDNSYTRSVGPLISSWYSFQKQMWMRLGISRSLKFGHAFDTFLWYLFMRF